MKRLMMAMVLGFSINASADMMRPIETSDLICKTKNKKITLSITSAQGRGTKLVLVEKGKGSKEFHNQQQLTVGSEGMVYIQQVSNELGYNFMVSGEGLGEVLSGKSKKVNLKGNIDLFKLSKQHDLVCSGTLS